MQNLIKPTDLRGKRILITGGLGFIGSNLAHKCLELGADVTIYDSLDPNSGGNLYNVKDIKNYVKLIYSDILDFAELSKHIVDKNIIFNCAASTSHPFSMKEPWINLDVNSRGVINLLEAARRFNQEIKFVHIGTSTQLGKLQFSPADETHPEFPKDIYSANKSVSEKYVLIYGNAYDMQVCVVRLSNVYGPRACISSPEFTFNNYFIGLALQNKNITIYKPGEQLRNIIFIYDAVEALIMASLDVKANKELLFAVGDYHYSILQIAEFTTKIIGGSVQFVEWPKERKAIDIGDAVISNKKIKDILHWKPKYGIEEGLVNTKEYFANCLDKYI